MAFHYPTSTFPVQFVNPDTGALASGFVIEAYLAGTSTPTEMFIDKDGTSAGTTVTLNSGGWPEVDSAVRVIWAQYGIEYKYILRDPATGAKWTIDNIGGVVLNDTIDRYDSMAALIAASPDSDSVYVTGYYAGWASTSGPKGGHFRHKTGATNASPTVGSAVAVSTIGTGTQAGYCWDASGAEWKLVDNDIDVFKFGAVGDNSTDDQAAFQDALIFSDDVFIPSGYTYLIGSTVTLQRERQRLRGAGMDSMIRYSGSGTAIDFDGWAGCACEDFQLYSTTGAIGVSVKPNSGSTRFAHWWRLSRLMVVGTTPNWASTALGSAIQGWTTAAIRVERSYYGAAYNCESSWSEIGFQGLHEHNACSYTGCQVRNCNYGVHWDGNNSSNGSQWIGGAIENAVGSETAGIYVGESDRNAFLGVRMECSFGTHIIVNPPGSTLAQENQFIGCIMGGTANAMTLGDGSGSNQVRGTFVSGGKMSGALTINSDCSQTHIEMSGTAASGITRTDNGYGTIMHLDPSSTGRYYERATTANTAATSVETTIAGGSVEKDYNDSYLNMSFSNLSNAFRFENVNAGGTELAIMRFGAYRVWVNPGDGKLYISGSAPTTASDGTVVGTQT